MDRTEYAAIKKELAAQAKTVDSLHGESRTLIKQSKKVIYALHRRDLPGARREATELKASKKRMDALRKKLSEGNEPGFLHVADQEYVEALAYLGFVDGGKVPPRKSLGVPTEAYLTGLCDLTGELVRRSVDGLIDGDRGTAERAKDYVAALYGDLIGLDLPGGEIRKKADFVRWNLNKLEDVLFETTVRGR